MRHTHTHTAGKIRGKNAFVMSVCPALFYMLRVEVHLRMREICQQICATQKTIIFLFHCNYRKKMCRKMVSLAELGTCNLEILQKQNSAIRLANTQICIYLAQY